MHVCLPVEAKNQMAEKPHVNIGNYVKGEITGTNMDILPSAFIVLFTN